MRIALTPHLSLPNSAQHPSTSTSCIAEKILGRVVLWDTFLVERERNGKDIFKKGRSNFND